MGKGAKASYPARWDPLTAGDRAGDDWIGEDAKGVWMTMHPEAALAARPHLWLPVSRFRCGVTEVSREDWESMSSVHYDAHLTLVAARSRALYGAPKKEA